MKNLLFASVLVTSRHAMSVLLARAMAVAATSAARRIPATPRHVMLARSHRPAAARARSVVTRCLGKPTSTSASTSTSFSLVSGGGGAPACTLTTRRSLTVIRAIPKKAASTYTYDPARLRASDEFNIGDEEDDDPFMHGGRPNKTALKKLMVGLALLPNTLLPQRHFTLGESGHPRLSPPFALNSS
jgi:hypothetical protein